MFDKVRNSFHVGAMLLILGLIFAIAQSWAAEEAHDLDGSHHQPEQATLIQAHLEYLPAIAEALTQADQAVRQGKTDQALAGLAQARKQLQAVRQVVGREIKPLILNAKCPITGDDIDLANLTTITARPYEGKYVAFCCADCGPEWDKLSTTQKQQKLAIVQPPQEFWTCSMHPQIHQAHSGTCPICGMNLVQAHAEHAEESSAGHAEGHDHSSHQQ